MKLQSSELRVYLAKQSASAKKALDAWDEHGFLADPSAVVEAVFTDFAIDSLSVADLDGITRGPTSEISKDGRRSDGSPYTAVISKRSFDIPFTGPAELWRYRAQTSYPEIAFEGVILQGDHFVFTHTGQKPTIDEVRSALNTAHRQLRETADWINADLAVWNKQLRLGLHNAADARKDRLGKTRALDDALGIPIKAAAPDSRIPVPVTRKPLRPHVGRPTPGSSTTPAPDKFLADDVYQDVVHTIEQMTRAMERTPTASKFGEEELRNLILIVLNANYEGTVRGEVFNGQGKTDLLLPWDGDNAFIGECKIWDGSQKFGGAIDQLLKYVTWRDTKAALVLFIKSPNPTDIIRKATETIAAHATHVRTESETADQRSDYVLRSPHDAERLVRVAFIPVVLPDS